MCTIIKIHWQDTKLLETVNIIMLHRYQSHIICIFIHHPPVDHIIDFLPWIKSFNGMEHEMQIHDKKQVWHKEN